MQNCSGPHQRYSETWVIFSWLGTHVLFYPFIPSQGLSCKTRGRMNPCLGLPGSECLTASLTEVALVWRHTGNATGCIGWQKRWLWAAGSVQVEVYGGLCFSLTHTLLTAFWFFIDAQRWVRHRGSQNLNPSGRLIKIGWTQDLNT